MEINKKRYPISENNYIQEINTKKRIIVGNSFTSDMLYVKGWGTRCGGQYKKTSAFSIDKDGSIYQHYDPKYYSEFLGDNLVDPSSIMVTLVNEGWLTQRDDGFYNLRNELFLGDVVNKYWRGYDFWAGYEAKQYESLIFLLRNLMTEFDIYDKVVSHNTRLTNPLEFNGMLTKSNFSKEYTDLSPTFTLDNLKTKLKK